jgi:FlaG/FlaF family flagellin (archaellin)
MENEAVSPVVGVMLMMALAVILAAVVSAFAGGFGNDMRKAPDVSIRVQTGYAAPYDGSNYDISFEHLGSDPIQTEDLEIITWLELANGTEVWHKQLPSSPCIRVSGNGYARLPYVSDPQKFGAEPFNTTAEIDGGDPVSGAWFGEVTWMPGQVARTCSLEATAAFLGLVEDDDIYPADDPAYSDGADMLEDCIDAHTTVEIKILHRPSGMIIYDEEIVLRE